MAVTPGTARRARSSGGRSRWSRIATLTPGSAMCTRTRGAPDAGSNSTGMRPSAYSPDTRTTAISRKAPTGWRRERRSSPLDGIRVCGCRQASRPARSNGSSSVSACWYTSRLNAMICSSALQ